MTEVKSFLKSKTVWGAVVAGLAMLAKILGYEFGLEDQTMLVDGIIGAVGIGGSLLAIYGRVVASKKLK